MPPNPRAPSSHFDPMQSASPASASTPPRQGMASSSSLGSLPPIEVKPQKACVLCRRSKVKCIHDGAPPCKRCRDTNQEAQCKFRLRADDETWRERTDDVLSKLGESVEWLVKQQQQAQQQQQHQQQPYPHHQVHQGEYKRSDSSGNSPLSGMAGSPRKSFPTPNLYRPSQGHSRSSTANSWHSHQQHDPATAASHNAAFHSPQPSMPHGKPSSTTYLGFDGAAGLLSPGDPHGRSTASVSPSAHQATRPYRSDSSASQSFHPLHHSQPPNQPPQPPSPFPRLSMNNLPCVPPLEPGQSRPSSIIFSAHQSCVENGEASKREPPRTTSISPYADPSHCIGRNDPRLTVISMGLVPMDQARHLFKFFARYLQPHCFGFPAYPPNENMTPLIIACILMVASMHEPNSRQLFERFRHEAFSSPLLLDQPIDPRAPLDPELGIGVEEITGACIASCWLGGQTALSVAQFARYWAIGYLEHFEVRSAQTLGEWMTILPPFRQIDLVCKLRIWLMSYIAEAHQALINDKPSLFPESQPSHYCQGLLNASSRSAALGEPQAGQDALNRVPEASNAAGDTPNSNYSQPSAAAVLPSSVDSASGVSSFASDSQLVAHARMMSILLAAQDLHRSARAAMQSGGSDTGVYGSAQMTERWREWLEELNGWRLLTSQHCDLSDNSAESVDLSLLYHLSRTFLASHPLDPELGILDETHQALRAAATKLKSPDFSRTAVAQIRTISTAKESALFALRLATSEFGERLSYLPQFYHWLLGHAAGMLLLLVQRKETFLMSKEADMILEVTEKFVQLYVFRVTSHSFHSAGDGDEGVQSCGSSRVKRSASSAELDADSEKSGGGQKIKTTNANGDDPVNIQWPFMSGFPTSPAQPANAASAPPNMSQEQLAHGNPAEKHPALANAQALARALYLVKMQIQTLQVQL